MAGGARRPHEEGERYDGGYVEEKRIKEEKRNIMAGGARQPALGRYSDGGNVVDGPSNRMRSTFAVRKSVNAQHQVAEYGSAEGRYDRAPIGGSGSGLVRKRPADQRDEDRGVWSAAEPDQERGSPPRRGVDGASSMRPFGHRDTGVRSDPSAEHGPSAEHRNSTGSTGIPLTMRRSAEVAGVANPSRGSSDPESPSGSEDQEADAPSLRVWGQGKRDAGGGGQHAEHTQVSWKLTEVMASLSEAARDAARSEEDLSQLDGGSSVVVTEVESVEELEKLHYYQQGNPELHTKEAISQRVHIRYTPELTAATERWWQRVPRQGELLLREEYLQMHAAIQRVVMPEVPCLPQDAEDDWENDSNGGDYINRELMANAVFQLADLWVPSLTVGDYVDFLDRLLSRIYPPSRAGPTKRGKEAALQKAKSVKMKADAAEGNLWSAAEKQAPSWEASRRAGSSPDGNAVGEHGGRGHAEEHVGHDSSTGGDKLENIPLAGGSGAVAPPHQRHGGGIFEEPQTPRSDSRERRRETPPRMNEQRPVRRLSKALVARERGPNEPRRAGGSVEEGPSTQEGKPSWGAASHRPNEGESAHGRAAVEKAPSEPERIAFKLGSSVNEQYEARALHGRYDGDAHSRQEARNFVAGHANDHGRSAEYELGFVEEKLPSKSQERNFLAGGARRPDEEGERYDGGYVEEKLPSKSQERNFMAGGARRPHEEGERYDGGYGEE
eukprot:gene12685-14994_t